LENYYIAFFDIKTNSVLLCIGETEKAGGVGMAKHWTKPFREFLDMMVTKNNWKKKYIGNR